MGLDDSVFGGGEMHQMGLSIPGLPLMAVGTNGYVGWSQTQLVGDITDWYREELKLDTAGAPKATIFQGKEVPVAKTDEKYKFPFVDAEPVQPYRNEQPWGGWVRGRVVAHDTMENLRRTMDETTLEGIFTRINDDQATRALAPRILEAMRS